MARVAFKMYNKFKKPEKVSGKPYPAEWFLILFDAEYDDFLYTNCSLSSNAIKELVGRKTILKKELTHHISLGWFPDDTLIFESLGDAKEYALQYINCELEPKFFEGNDIKIGKCTCKGDVPIELVETFSFKNPQEN